ncbi:MAG: hypothetical protein PHX46_03940 [Bacilli bacterium]|nr:hypothetical protein [Bacilli bacterium]
MGKRKTHEKFIEEMNIINPNIEIKGIYTTAQDYIDVKCKKCGGEWSPIANSLLRGNGCPYCCPAPRKILIGFNDMWTTNPELAKLLANPEDGYKYTQKSNKKVDWKCPNCGYIIKNKCINDISNRGLSCNICSDGISYAEKFMASLFNQINVYFEKEKIFQWSSNRRYDFYLSDLNIIIETHGIQHYDEVGFMCISKRARNLNEEKNNDIFKFKLAKSNNINDYIVIDTRFSDFNYIKNNIINSKLSMIFDLTIVDWKKCHEYACSNLVKEACNYWNNNIKNAKDIAFKMGISHPTIIEYLKQGAELGWCDYNPKESLRRGAKKRTNNRKRVMCIETGIIYESLTEAAKSIINGSDSHISQCCKKKRNTCGRLEDGIKLHWQYV